MMQSTKRCPCPTHVGERELPGTLEFFPGDKRSRDGLLSWCRECGRAKTRRINGVRRRNDPEFRQRQINYMQVRRAELESRGLCRQCGKQPAATERSSCAECLAYQVRYSLENKRRGGFSTSTKAAILDRDGPVCAAERCLCPTGRAIDLVLSSKDHDRWALSFDHVTPRSLSGTDSTNNGRPAHLACNSSRGNRITQGEQ